MSDVVKIIKAAGEKIKALEAERDEYRAIALRLIRVYRVDDQAWAPDEEAEKVLEKEFNND